VNNPVKNLRSVRKTWRCAQRKVDFSSGGRLVGILNVTPDSFSDGGRFAHLETAVTHGLSLIGEGAAILDVGGESTRPGAEPVPVEVELERVVPVIRRLREADREVILSVDTSKAAVAAAAVEAGADVINDVTGLTGDRGMVEVVAQSGAGVVIMHMQGTPATMQVKPEYEDVVQEVRAFFTGQWERALEAGIEEEQIVFDPGIGFGKTVEHNLALLRHLGELTVAGRPLMLGVSRKSLFRRALGAGPEDLGLLTAACTALARTSGVLLHRVHDVRESFLALRLAEAMLPGGEFLCASAKE
jgi:dihydropteroate synthase